MISTPIHRRSRIAARVISLALVTVMVCAVGPTARAISPLRIDTKILLITPDGTEPAFTAWKVALDAEGVPYDTFYTLQSPDITASTLTVSSTEARYQALILTSDDLVYRDPILGYISSLSSSEWQAVHDFETTFSIRQISTYVYPKPSVGLNYPTFAGNLDGTVGQVTGAGHDEFPYLTGPVPVDGVWGYLSTPINPLTFQTILQAPGGQSLCGIDTHTDTREELLCTMDASQWTTHFKLLSHGLLGWATRGTYLGQLRNYFSAHIDDLFLQSDRWDEASHTNGPPYIRMTAADVTRAKNWSQANNQRLDFLFNADGSGPNDPLTQAILANKNVFGFESHTFTHLTLNPPVDQTRIEWEISQNVAWANQNGVTIDPHEITTGGHSGLTNPVTPAAFANQGIQWFGSDASLSKQQSTLGSATSVPRYPTNVYYNVSTQSEQLDEYNYILYTQCRAQNLGGCLPAPVTWSQYVTNSANQILTHILANDPRPHFFHQANVAEDGVFYTVIDEVLRLYHQYRAGALVQPTLTEAGRLLKQQASWTAARTSGAVSGYIQNGMLTLTSTSAVDVPVTGSNVGPVAAGERSGFVTLAPNIPLSIPALGPAAANLPPVASNLTRAGTEDIALPVTLSATDPDLNPLTYSIVAQPAHGTLSGAAPLLTYTPAADYAGSDSFTYKASDGALDSNVATVQITLAAVNDAPVADPKTIDAAHAGKASPLTLSGSDVDNGALTFQIATSPSHGSLSAIGAPVCVAAGQGASCTASLTYTAAAGYTGADSFAYVARDALTSAAPAVVTVSVDNVTPAATAQTIATNEDTSAPITLAGTDSDADPLTYSVVSQPAHGTLSGTAPNLSYDPAPDYNGADSFTFRANDGIAASAPATISMVVNAINDAPTSDPKSIGGAHQGTATAISLTGADVDNQSLTFSVVTVPAHGSLSSLGAPSCAGAGAGSTCSSAVSYTSAPGYTGTDSFTYRVSDGSASSAISTVTITVTNNPPVASNQSVTTAEDTARAITLTASDPDGDPLSYSIVTQPGHGTLSGTAPALTYTPDTDYNGGDSFTFRASDGGATSNGTVSIAVTPVNDVPAADPKTLNGAHQSIASSLTLSGSDIDSGALTFRVVSQPQHGSLSPVASPSCVAVGAGAACTAAISYTAANGYSGSDAFTYVTNDGSADSISATVSVSVGNSPPLADAVAYQATEDTPRALTLTGSDPDADPLTFTVVTQPAHGTLSGIAPVLTYTPASDYNGPDSFTFKTGDATSQSAPATISLSVLAVNDAPSADPKTLSGAHQKRASTIVLSGADVDSASPTFRIIANPAHGTLSSINSTACVGAAAGSTCTAQIIYTGAAGYVGSDSFTYALNDGALTGPAASVAITSLNAAPIAYAQTVNVTEGSPWQLSLGASDPDADALTFTVVSQPANGSLSGTAPNLTYTPTAGYAGTDSLTFRVSDGIATSSVAAVAISVIPHGIAFSSDRGGNRDIYRVGADGLDLVRLTTSTGIDTDPTWSTDGSKITFSSGRDGNNEIYIMKSDGTQVTRLTFGSASDTRPSWNPSGTKIAFASTRTGNGDVYVMDSNGLNVKRLTSSTDVEGSPSWSPDGTKIVYQRGSDVYTMKSDGTSQTRIGQPGTTDAHPTWSPNGSLIVGVGGSGNSADIWTVKPDGSSPKRLTSNSYADLYPAWNRDGSQLAFSSNRDGNYEIYIMNADGSGQTRLTVNSASDTLPDW